MRRALMSGVPWYSGGGTGGDEDDTFIPGAGFLRGRAPALWHPVTNAEIAAAAVDAGDVDHVHVSRLRTFLASAGSSFWITHSRIKYALAWWRDSDWAHAPTTASGWASAAPIKNDLETAVPGFPLTTNSNRTQMGFHAHIRHEGTPVLPSGTFSFDLTEYEDQSSQAYSYFWNDAQYQSGTGISPRSGAIDDATYVVNVADRLYERVAAASVVQSNLTIRFGATARGNNVIAQHIPACIAVARVEVA